MAARHAAIESACGRCGRRCGRIAARIAGGAVAVQAHYGVLNPQASWRTQLITIAKGAFHIVRSRARERLGLSCGIRGNGWCVTHELLQRVPYRCFSLTEDLEYGIQLGLAGLRVGYGIACPELAAALEKIRQPFNANLLAQTAALAALDDDEHVRKTRQNNFTGLEFFMKAFRQLHLEFVPSYANFILVRVGEGQKVFDAMQKLGVITRPMGGYQLPEWIRISIGTPKENERSLTALKTVVGQK